MSKKYSCALLIASSLLGGCAHRVEFAQKPPIAAAKEWPQRVPLAVDSISYLRDGAPQETPSGIVRALNVELQSSGAFWPVYDLSEVSNSSSSLRLMVSVTDSWNFNQGKNMLRGALVGATFLTLAKAFPLEVDFKQRIEARVFLPSGNQREYAVESAAKLFAEIESEKYLGASELSWKVFSANLKALVGQVGADEELQRMAVSVPVK